MIGEYHFGAADRNHFHPGLSDAGSQALRGDRYQTYAKSGLRNPAVVGIHWFQYTDQAITGRSDGENYNAGLVDVTDTPYPALMAAVREIGETMYDLRTAKESADAR